MFKITKSEPTFFVDAKRKANLPKTSTAWSDEAINEIRFKLREHILLKEQNFLCAYCEKQIDSDSKNSNIDHFRLKAGHLFPEQTLDYNNLLVSCNTHGRCSNHKDKHIKSKDAYDNIINPITENPDYFFDYLTTGKIVAKDDNHKAEFSIELFQLGQESLNRQREEISKSLKSIPNLSLDEVFEAFGNEFSSFIKAIYPKLNQKGATL